MELVGILFGGGFTLLVCYSLGRLCLSRIPAPRVMALPVGGAIVSLAVYALLLAGWVSAGSFVALGVCALVPLLWEFKRPAPHAELNKPLDAITRWLLIDVFTVYGVFYLVHTIAPEVQPDAVYYHLGLVAGYFRLGGFSRAHRLLRHSAARHGDALPVCVRLRPALGGEDCALRISRGNAADFGRARPPSGNSGPRFMDRRRHLRLRARCRSERHVHLHGRRPGVRDGRRRIFPARLARRRQGPVSQSGWTALRILLFD